MRNAELKKLKLIIFFTIIISLLIQGCGEELAPPPTEPETPGYEGVIVAVGDSLTEGLGLAEEFAYPAVLEKKLRGQDYKYQVINAGISGETSSGTLSRIKWVLTLKPDIVILVIGANDGFRGLDPDLIKTNIQKIIRQLKDENVIVVLGAMQIVQNLGKDYTTAFANIYLQIAQSENIILTPFFLKGVATNQKLNQADGIHPTAEGYQVIVDNITPYV
ncbi:MAG: arylesterase, partial [Proteobacteria bacterium]|nr:arylesterase [Pseudomonadota bacterium]